MIRKIPSIFLVALVFSLLSAGIAWAETTLPIMPLEVNPYLEDDFLDMPQELVEPQMPGRLESTGTHFELTDSEYINVTLDSSAPIKLTLESMPEMVTMQLEAASDATSAQITLGGFAPFTTYHKYEDNYHNHTAFTTDEKGNYSYTQDLSKAHIIFIQPRPSTIFLSDSGWSKSGIGTWDPVTKTAVLTQDVNETIQIDSDGITLDGNGHTITGSGTGSGVYLYGRTGVTVKNVTVQSFFFGILLDYSKNNTITSNVTSNNYYGVRLAYSSDNILANINADSNRYNGISFEYYSHHNILTNSSANYNLGYGVFSTDFSDCTVNNCAANHNGHCGFYLAYCNGSVLTNSISDGNRNYGLYFSQISYGTFSGNTISRNGCGIFMFYCKFNDIYNNNFIGNLSQTISRGSSSNRFNLGKPIGGNYWSNWTAPDSDGDGFVDNPYYIGYSADYLPWIRPNGWEPEASDETPPTTTINLSGTTGDNGWYTSEVQVSFTAVDNEGGSGVAKTEYSFNGTSWMNYSVPFTVKAEGTTDIYYRSTDNVGNVEETKEQSVSKDTIPPVTTVHLDGILGQNDWYTSDVTVTMMAVDNEGGSGVARTEYSFDSENWLLYTGPFVLTAEGTTTLYYRSIDNAGNVEVLEDETETINCPIDKEVPDVTIGINPPDGDNGWYKSPPEISLGGGDAGSGMDEIRYRLDDGGWQTYTDPFSITNEGTTTVYYYAVDRAGNAGPVQEHIVRFDPTPPSISIDVDDGWYSSAPEITLSAGDGGGSGIDRIGYRIGDEPWQPYLGPITPPGEGEIPFEYCTRDRAGNRTYKRIIIKIDKTAPVTTIKLEGVLGQNDWYISDVKVTLEATDSVSGVARTEYSLDGVYWLVYTGPFMLANEGITTVYYRSTDVAGNVEVTKEQEVRIDKSAPLININVPVDGAEYSLGEIVLADWTATDTVSGLASAVGTVPSGTPINTFMVGEHTFTVEATDNAGNHAMETVTYYVRYANFWFLPPNKTTVKLGSAVPVKFQIEDANGNYIADANARIYLAKVENGVAGIEVEGVPTGSAKGGNLFRYDSDDDLYIFNLSTKNLSVGTWRVRVELNDGSSKYLEITLR